MLVIKKDETYWSGTKFVLSYRLAEIYDSYLVAGAIMEELKVLGATGLKVTHLTASQKLFLANDRDWMHYVEVHGLEQRYWNSKRLDTLLKKLDPVVEDLLGAYGFHYDLDTKCQNTCDSWHLVPEDQQTEAIKSAFNHILNDFIAYIQEWEPD